MIWDIIENKLEGISLTPGASLFRNMMPADVVVGVMMRAPLQGIRIDPYMPGFHKTFLQAIVRHKDPVEGMALAEQVSRALTVTGAEIYPATAERGRVRLSVFYPRELPIQFPRLDGNGIEWSINFVTAFAIEPLA